ncbi:MAG: gliding motility-associated C-terminal domain-containing protein [Cyclobacteriaceae bacterium]
MSPKSIPTLVFLGFIGFMNTPSQAQSACNEECLEIFLPNVITPNGDGVNDFFTIALGKQSCTCEIREISLVIYNRWGNEVFCFFDSDYDVNDIKWYGEAGEAWLSETCYYYKAEIGFELLQTRVFKGWVKIIRRGEM